METVFRLSTRIINCCDYLRQIQRLKEVPKATPVFVFYLAYEAISFSRERHPWRVFEGLVELGSGVDNSWHEFVFHEICRINREFGDNSLSAVVQAADGNIDFTQDRFECASRDFSWTTIGTKLDQERQVIQSLFPIECGIETSQRWTREYRNAQSLYYKSRGEVRLSLGSLGRPSQIEPIREIDLAYYRESPTPFKNDECFLEMCAKTNSATEPKSGVALGDAVFRSYHAALFYIVAQFQRWVKSYDGRLLTVLEMIEHCEGHPDLKAAFKGDWFAQAKLESLNFDRVKVEFSDDAAYAREKLTRLAVGEEAINATMGYSPSDNELDSVPPDIRDAINSLPTGIREAVIMRWENPPVKWKVVTEKCNVSETNVRRLASHLLKVDRPGPKRTG